MRLSKVWKKVTRVFKKIVEVVKSVVKAVVKAVKKVVKVVNKVVKKVKKVVKKYGKVILAVAAVALGQWYAVNSILLSGLTGLSSAVAGGAIGGFLSGGIMTGSLSGAFKGALFGGLAAGLAFGIGHGAGGVSPFKTSVGKAVAHGASQGAVGALRGGSFKSGFLGGLVGSLVGGIQLGAGKIAKGVMSMVAGGAAAAAAGGKFANGAVSAAFVYLFNDTWAISSNVTGGSGVGGQSAGKAVFYYDEKNPLDFTKWGWEMQKEAGLGGVAGANASWTLTVEKTNAKSLSDTHGKALNAAITGGEVIVGEVGYIYSKNYTGKYLGIGLGLSATPVSAYVMTTNTDKY